MTMPLRLSAALILAALAACTPAVARTPPVNPAPVPVVLPPPPSREAVLAQALDSIFNDTLFAGANWGVEIRSGNTGQVLYERNAGKMFVPASNMKIVTAAAALETLGRTSSTARPWLPRGRSATACCAATWW